ncbi:MAG: c-type cytochrome [Chloroflexota bacterium]|jgi:mono/diheme cytochrome c family protein
MKKVLKWIAIIVGGLLLLVVVAAVGLALAGTARLNKTYDVSVASINIPDDEAALARGEHLTNVFCSDCHGADLSGQPFFDEPPIGTIYTANLTGLAETHSDEELVKAIRHGLDSDGRALMIMPSESFIHFSEADLGAVIAYLKTLPRSGSETPEKVYRPLGRILTGLGAFDSSMPATYMDHDQPFPAMPTMDDSVAYGEYLSRFCQSCHGPDLTGGQTPDPESPPAPNLAADGSLGGWAEADFITAIRTGMTPRGHELNGQFMPWESFGKLSDEELSALWQYLDTLPPRQTAAE